MRLMFRWPIAANEPSAIEPIDTKTMICCQSGPIGSNGVMVTRTISAIAAIFGADAKNAVTGVGAPS